MFWQRIPAKILAPKYILNGFPKAGLHVVALMVEPVVSKMPVSELHNSIWIGTFEHNSWTNQWADMRQQLYAVSRLTQGHYFKAHAGYHEDLERMMYHSAIAHVFIYRDPRDVAVSQTHHILDPDDNRFRHADKGIYQKLGGFDEVLMTVIEGLGPYPSVMDRWALYAKWLEAEWTHSVSFEELIEDRVKCAGDILKYGWHRITSTIGWDEGLRVDDEEYQILVEKMVENSHRTERSTTFRKGEVGGWKESFTDEHKAAFKTSDKDDWLVKLGYEDSEDW